MAATGREHVTVGALAPRTSTRACVLSPKPRSARRAAQSRRRDDHAAVPGVRVTSAGPLRDPDPIARRCCTCLRILRGALWPRPQACAGHRVVLGPSSERSVLEPRRRVAHGVDRQGNKVRTISRSFHLSSPPRGPPFWVTGAAVASGRSSAMQSPATACAALRPVGRARAGAGPCVLVDRHVDGRVVAQRADYAVFVLSSRPNAAGILWRMPSTGVLNFHRT